MGECDALKRSRSWNSSQVQCDGVHSKQQESVHVIVFMDGTDWASLKALYSVAPFNKALINEDDLKGCSPVISVLQKTMK